MHRKCTEDFGIFENVSWVESCLRRSRLTFACLRRPWAGVARDGGGRWKSLNRKNVYLSPYVEEPLNSKVIKSFVPEPRSRKCFSCFEIHMFYVYMLYIWTFLCIFPIFRMAMLHWRPHQAGGYIQVSSEKQVIISWLCIGHTSLIHSFILKLKQPPQCLTYQTCSIPFPVQNGSSSVQNGNSLFKNRNSSVQNGKIIISINIKKYFINYFSNKIVNILQYKKNSSSHLLEHNIF